MRRAKQNNWKTRITEFAIAPFGGLPGFSGNVLLLDLNMNRDIQSFEFMFEVSIFNGNDITQRAADIY